MTLDPEILSILRCPHCRTQVVLDSATGWLSCVSCERSFQSRDDILIMIEDDDDE